MTRWWWGGILLFALLIGLAGVPDAAAQRPEDREPAMDQHQEAVDVTVNCSAGHSITHVLRTVPRSPLTIIVRGICNENVTITRNDVTLQGVGAGSGITGPDTTRDTILINGAQRVTLDSLTVSGGYNGVNGRGGAAFTVQHSIIQNAGNQGIMVAQHSQAFIDSTVVKENTKDGVHVFGGSQSTLTNNTISSNGNYGVSIIEGSTAGLGVTDAGLATGNLIEDNSTDGVQVNLGSSALLYANTIQRNARLYNTDPTNTCGPAGVSVVERSALKLAGLNIITGNYGVGIYVRASTIRAFPLDPTFPPLSNDISNNGGGGIYALEGSVVDLYTGVTIVNNSPAVNWRGFGILLIDGSRLRINASTVSGNSPGGIRLQFDSSVHFLSGNSITNNFGPGLDCTNNGASGSYVNTFSGGGNSPGGDLVNCTHF